MKNLNLMTRMYFQEKLHSVIGLVSSKLAKKYQRHQDKTYERLGIKAVRKGMTEVLELKMEYFCRFPKFRRELILSDLPDRYVIYMLHLLKSNNLDASELELIALNRNFTETETQDLYYFKVALFNSLSRNKEEIIKIFYKNSAKAEESATISEMLLQTFRFYDQDFLYWHAINGGSYVIKSAVVEYLASDSSKIKNYGLLKKLIEEQGLADCGLERLGHSKLLLDIRKYITKDKDIEIWERYLFTNDTRIIKEYIRCYGLKTKTGYENMLRLNDQSIVDSYNAFKREQKN